MSNTLNKDFYSYIPLWMQNNLDMKILLYGNEEWFIKAWNDYRKMCLTMRRKDIQEPDVFFAKAERDFSELVSSDDIGTAFSEDLEDALHASEDIFTEEEDMTDEKDLELD